MPSQFDLGYVAGILQLALEWVPRFGTMLFVLAPVVKTCAHANGGGSRRTVSSPEG
jgi:hypothetical protein